MNEDDLMEKRRHQLIDRLTERYAKDELPLTEYERLVQDAQNAVEMQDLAVVETIVGGSGYSAGNQSAAARQRKTVPRGPQAPFVPQAAEPHQAPVYAPQPPDSPFYSPDLVQSSVSILADRRHTGKWLKKPTVAAISILGSQIFDFRGIDLPVGITTLEALAILGSIEIIVPTNLAVRMEVLPVAGDATVDKDVESGERPGEPVLVVTGNAILGSVRVRVK